MRAEVDVLTLTATPIPRTLAMSLEGIRDFSVIATAPSQERATRPETIRALSGRDDVVVTPTVADALTAARSLAPDVIFVTGSLFVVAEARSLV